LAFGAGVVEGSMVFIPALLVAAFGVSESKASFMLLPVVATLSVGAPLFGHGLDKVGSRWVIMLGTALAAVGTAMLGFVHLSTAVFYIAAILIGFGLSALLGAPLRYIMLAEAPAEERASAQALISVMTKVGQMMTGAVVGAVAASMGGGVAGYVASFRVLGGIAVVLFLLSLLLKTREAERATQSQTA
jgi:MFS family permease